MNKCDCESPGMFYVTTTAKALASSTNLLLYKIAEQTVCLASSKNRCIKMVYYSNLLKNLFLKTNS